MCVYACAIYAHYVCKGAGGGQKRDLGLQAVVSHVIWLLGTLQEQLPLLTMKPSLHSPEWVAWHFSSPSSSVWQMIYFPLVFAFILLYTCLWISLLLPLGFHFMEHVFGGKPISLFSLM